MFQVEVQENQKTPIKANSASSACLSCCKEMRFSKGEATYFVPGFKNNCLNLSKSAMRILNCLVMNPAPLHRPLPVGRKQKYGGFHPHPFSGIVLPALVNFGGEGFI